MPLKEGWEVSPDRQYIFEKILSTDDVGDPIITSKTKDGLTWGFLLVSNKGFAFRQKKIILEFLSYTPRTSNKWVRWHDVADIVPKNPGSILVEVKKRKEGLLLIDKRFDVPKTKNWKLTITLNKNENKIHFKQRKAEFNSIMMELFNQYKSDSDPLTSESRI